MELSGGELERGGKEGCRHQQPILLGVCTSKQESCTGRSMVIPQQLLILHIDCLFINLDMTNTSYRKRGKQAEGNKYSENKKPTNCNSPERYLNGVCRKSGTNVLKPRSIFK